jgi:tetratricopeptide (TPR) repeat protein
VGVFEGLGDEEGLASAWSGLAGIEWVGCRYETALDAAERAAGNARLAGDRRLLKEALTYQIGAQYLGTTRPEEGIAAMEAVAEEIGDDVVFVGFLSLNVGMYRAMAGDIEEGRRRVGGALERFEQFGLGFWRAATYEQLGALETWAGEPQAAEHAYRQNYELLDRAGDEAHKSTAAAGLALALCRLERFDEAEGYARTARESAADDDITSQAGGRAAEAGVRSARGDHAAAVSLAREAARLYVPAQTPNYQGEIAMVLAEVLRAAGDLSEAADAARDALGYFEAKGNRPAAAQASSFLDALTP